MTAASPRTPIRPWLPVLLIACVIWLLGSEGFSQPETSRFLGPLLEWLLPGLDPDARAELTFFVRKLAHPAEYGLLALLSYRAISIASPDSSSAGLLARGLLPVIALACADELRQAFTSTRTGSAWDVALDVAGGAVTLMLLAVLRAWLGRPLFGRPAGVGR